LSHVVIPVVKETESSQQKQIDLSKSAIDPVHALERSGVENLTQETPKIAFDQSEPGVIIWGCKSRIIQYS
jgi:hypothetical protein